MGPFSLILLVKCGHFKVADGILHELHGVQHQLEVGWLQQKHDVLENEVVDIIKSTISLHIAHVMWPIFQGEPKVRTSRGARGNQVLFENNILMK